jgi:hypothetical protein
MVRAGLKYGRLANRTPADVTGLRDHLPAELDRAAFDGGLPAGSFNHANRGVQVQLRCFAHAGLSNALFSTNWV